jgi:hypothetical protein
VDQQLVDLSQILQTRWTVRDHRLLRHPRYWKNHRHIDCYKEELLIYCMILTLLLLLLLRLLNCHWRLVTEGRRIRRTRINYYSWLLLVCICIRYWWSIALLLLLLLLLVVSYRLRIVRIRNRLSA